MAYSQLRNGNNHYRESEPEVVVTTSSNSNRKEEAKRLQHQKKVFIFAIAELVLGIICVSLGGTLVGLIASRRWYTYTVISDYGNGPQSRTRYIRLVTTGEGIWCGIWIIVSGALGLFSAKKNVSNCMLICNMSFSIVGAIFTGVMIIIGVVGAISSGELARELGIVHVLVLYCFLCLFALISMILLILSAAYSCRLVGCCDKDSAGCCTGSQGCDCCLPYPNYTSAYGGQVVFTQQPQVGRNGVMVVSQQQAFAGQRIMYAGQPVMYPPQPAVGSQGVVYSQQATMPFQGTQNAQQGYVVPASQPASAAMVQVPQPGIQQGVNMAQPPAVQPSQQTPEPVYANAQKPSSVAAPTELAA